MKKILSLLLCCIGLSAFATHTTFSKLAEVNICWKDQPDISATTLPSYVDRSETEWIRTHLALVENTLRKRTTHHLTSAQQHNRATCLNYLHNYHLTGNFPVNDLYNYRTPIFIDRYDNFCAVGYMLKASGYEHISRMIAATTNLAYVRQMHYPELNKWATDNGFTVDELAWIQPGYMGGGDTSYCANIGTGVNGEVCELYADDAAGRMYVGGTFTIANGTVPASGIAYITPTGADYEWHSMGAGITGTVNAIVKYGDKIFAGGSFSSAGGAPASNVAWWDGTVWHAAGCVNGTVKDLVVIGDTLFAGGRFDDCASGMEANFAKWDGSSWLPIYGIHGHINSFANVGDGLLYIGGGFTFDTVKNIMRWWHGFIPFESSIRNEVMEIQATSSGVGYAACKQTHATDTNLLFANDPDDWSHSYFSGYLSSLYMRPRNGIRSVNTLFLHFPYVEIGGEFLARAGTNEGCYYHNNNEPLKVDSTVNKIAAIGSTIIFGGRFKYGTGEDGISYTELNGIARRKGQPIYHGGTVSAPLQQLTATATISPNPAMPGEILTLRSDFKVHTYTINDMAGKQLAIGTVSNRQQLTMPQVPAGIYMITVTGDNGIRKTEKVVAR